MWKIARWTLYIGCGVIGVANLYIIFTLLPLIDYPGYVELLPEYRDAVHMAMQTGRLDLITGMLGVLAVGLGLLAFFGFGYVKVRSEALAKEEARERVLEILPEMVPPLVARHVSLISDDDSSDEVAAAVDPEDSDG